MKLYQASYDTRFIATVDDKGGLQIAEVPGEMPSGSIVIPADGVGAVTIRPKAAKPIIAALEDASEMHFYDDDQINVLHHWILARAYNEALAR